MNEILAFTVPKHSVRMLENGLSGLQNELLGNPAPVRVASAPTGAGKSYGFLRAVLDRDAKILFVVPTRRLAQNLAASLVQEIGDANLRNGTRFSPSDYVSMWTSDETARLKEVAPGIVARHVRIDDVRRMGDVPHGKFIIATPESVAHLIIRGNNRVGETPFSLADFIHFNHIVFDEFHTIDARGFGLAATVCRMATVHREHGLKVSFLSATPVDIIPVLCVLDIPREDIAVLSEDVVTNAGTAPVGLRALHGDVRFSFVSTETGTLASVLRGCEERVRNVLLQGGQVVVIYDSVQALMRDKPDLAAFFNGVGIGLDQRLALNSYDDSLAYSNDGSFIIGRINDPRNFKAVIGTSSIEIGVTLRTQLIIMDPGHGPASFVQRSGRVARGDVPGEVVVLASDDRLRRDPWINLALRKLKGQGDRIDIAEFIKAFLNGTARQLDDATDLGIDDAVTFATLSQRAVWTSALFWVAVARSFKLSRSQADSVMALAPNRAKLIAALLSSISRDPYGGARWAKAFEAEALRFREIGRTVTIITGSGNKHTIPWLAYATFEAFRDGHHEMDSEGRLTVRIDKEFSEAFISDKRKAYEAVSVRYPHKPEICDLPAYGAPDAYVNKLKLALREPGRHQSAIKAAIRLVSMTKILPLAETTAKEVLAEAQEFSDMMIRTNYAVRSCARPL